MVAAGDRVPEGLLRRREDRRRPRVQGELPVGAPLIIHYVVRKPLTPKRAKRAYQTDYVQRWND